MLEHALNGDHTKRHTVSILSCFTARSPKLLLPTTDALVLILHRVQAPCHGEQPYIFTRYVSVVSAQHLVTMVESDVHNQ